jgi:hypothetical protein
LLLFGLASLRPLLLLQFLLLAGFLVLGVAAGPRIDPNAARAILAGVGFTVGCGLGAACEAAIGLWSLALPAGLALLALAMGVGATRHRGHR